MFLYQLIKGYCGLVMAMVIVARICLFMNEEGWSPLFNHWSQTQRKNKTKICNYYNYTYRSSNHSWNAQPSKTWDLIMMMLFKIWRCFLTGWSTLKKGSLIYETMRQPVCYLCSRLWNIAQQSTWSPNRAWRTHKKFVTANRSWPSELF